MFKIFISILFPYLLFAESAMNLRVCVDPSDTKNLSHIDIISNTNFLNNYCSIVLTPEVALYLNGSADFGISLGHRWEYKSGIFGHHVFYDRSQFPFIAINQIGTGIDFLTDKIDFRANYYHPISPSYFLRNRIVKPCKWLEGEVTYKTSLGSISYGPTINMETKDLGLQGKLNIPFERFSLGIGAIIDQTGNKQGFISTNFNLFESKNNETFFSPLSHNKRAKFILKNNFEKKKIIKEQDVIIEEKNEINELKEEDLNFEDSVKKYWKERWEKESKENEMHIPFQNEDLLYEEKGFWQTIKDFFSFKLENKFDPQPGG